MRRLLLAALTIAAVLGLALPASNTADAAMAASQSRMPGAVVAADAMLDRIQYLVDSRKYHRGCYRPYYCGERYWRCDYYGCKWHYGRCYYGDCYGRGGHGGNRY